MITPLGEVTCLPLGQVRPSSDNPRKIPAAAVDIVAKSITEFGWQQPIVVDTDRVVIAGHTRLLAAKKLGLESVPAVVADRLTAEQVRAYRIADNRSGDFTSWDFPALSAQLDELAAEFSEVLALADWESIVSDFEATSAAPSSVGAGAPAGVADPDPAADQVGLAAGYLSGEFTITVVCDSERAARRVAAAVIDMPGVCDVRDKR